MTKNYVALLGGNNIQSKVAKELNVDTNVVSSALSISNETDTQIISISATTTDPQLSKKIVDTTVDVFTNEVKETLNIEIPTLSEFIKETLNINNITTVDDAKLQTSPVSPSVPKNIVIGGLVGAILSIGIIFIRFMLDNRLHTKEDVEKYLEIPNLGVIPYFED